MFALCMLLVEVCMVRDSLTHIPSMSFQQEGALASVRPGEEPHRSLLHQDDVHDQAPAERDAGEASTRATVEGAALPTCEARALQLRQSLCYVGTFIAAGLVVGTCGPALPTLLKRIGGEASSEDGKDEQPASLAAAFAFRALGGVAGSIGGGAALVRIVPDGGHRILVAGLFFMAVSPVVLCYAASVSHVALAFILLDLGCGIGQVANTMIVWVNPQGATQWLNILNGSFGIGTLISPALVAILDAFLGSTSAAVESALLLVPLFVFLVVLLSVYVPSPAAPPPEEAAGHNSKSENSHLAPGDSESGNSAAEAAASAREAQAGLQAGECQKAAPTKISADRWQWAAAVALTVCALNCAVGAETTFGTFLVAYVETQREAGLVDVSEVQADLMTSFFWTSFTVGRFGSVFLERVFPAHPVLIIAVQILVLEFGWMAAALAPSSGVLAIKRTRARVHARTHTHKHTNTQTHTHTHKHTHTP